MKIYLHCFLNNRFPVLFFHVQVCFHGATKHENEVNDMIGCLQVVRI